MLKLLSKALAENHIQASDDALNKLVHFLDLMQTWNRVYNLTSITDPTEMVYLHIIDSLVIQPFLHGDHLLDVGSGAGLPGIPLAILHPDQHWTLLDKNSKKTRFMTQAAAELGLGKVKVMHSRVEDFHPEQAFDSILSRAFSSLSDFVTSTAHLLKSDGYFLAMKGKYPDDEIKSLPEKFHLQKVERLDIKGMNVERHLVIIN